MQNVQLDGQTVDNVNTGSVVVGTTVGPVSANTRTLKWGVQVVADTNNTNGVWVGRRSNLTAGGSPATDGFKLPPGGTIFVPSPSEAEVFCISDAVTQNATFLSY